MADKIRLVPVTGKYCQIQMDNTTIKIWRVLPGAGKDEKGTPVDYKLAVELLKLQPPVVSLVPVVKDGKFVSQLKESDATAIREAQSLGQSGISNHFGHAQSLEEAKANAGNGSAALETANKALAEAMALTKERNEELTLQLQQQTKVNEELAARLDALEKASKKDSTK